VLAIVRPGEGAGGGARAVAETVQHFITAMDSLKLNLVAVDQVGREGGHVWLVWFGSYVLWSAQQQSCCRQNSSSGVEVCIAAVVLWSA
jgi:hypothetical protein